MRGNVIRNNSFVNSFILIFSKKKYEDMSESPFQENTNLTFIYYDR